MPTTETVTSDTRKTEKTIAERVALARTQFDSGRTRGERWRRTQLEGLARMMKERESDIAAALREDLGKSDLESYATEVGYTLAEVKATLKNLGDWMKPTKVRSPLTTQPAKSYIHKDPLGVVLVIAPWNYPFSLSVAPLVGAIAAGNAAILKPSEVAPATSAVLARLLPRYVDDKAIQVIEGGIPETTDLLAERFDHILYTGNGGVGRIVMAAAAKHLTPVTLELGGKSPTIVDETANLDVTAKRICWGKYLNTGQTCVAPDYILAHERVYEPLLKRLAATVRDFFGDDPQQSPDYGRIINVRHHQRLMKLMDSGEAIVGGQGDEADRYIAPTVLRDVDADSAVMNEEIFGPILPVLKVRNLDEAISFVNARPKPLALYLFSEDKATQRDVLRRTSSGGATVNHAFMHMANHDLPFGGVGESGMGCYHGKASFDTFTHEKSVMVKPTKLDAPVIYPPFDDTKKKILRFAM